MNSKNILEEVKIEGLSFLKTIKLNVHSVERISWKNLNSLKILIIKCCSLTYSSLQNGLIDYLKKTIEIFKFNNGSFRIDYVYDYDFYKNDKIKSLFISFHNTSDCNEEFNFDFIQHLYNRINKLVISYSDYANLLKLVSEQNFPYLEELQISFCKISRLERKILSGSFPAIQSLKIMSNKDFEKIQFDSDAFSNLKQLKVLVIDGKQINLRSFETIKRI